MARFYEAYDQAFVIDSEKEDMGGFQACLALNSTPEYDRLSKTLGPYREIVLILSDSETEAVIGGASFGAFSAMDQNVPCVTANLSYIFVSKAYRRRGEFRRFLAVIEDLLPKLFVSDDSTRPMRSMIFLEQNDPLEMSAEDYALDTAHAGIDQFDRLLIWRNQGARLLRLAYSQPALAADQQPTSGLLYGVLSPELAVLDACLVAAHLRAFFTVSVLKGRDPSDDPVAGPQIALLEDLCSQGRAIDLLDPGPILTAIAAGAEIPVSETFLDLMGMPASDREGRE
jgi:hypothetical protein